MTLRNLKRLIDYAIDDCQRIIRNNPKAVLSEGDFERILSSCIAKRIGYFVDVPDPNDFAIYTQISHYKNETKELDARVDILLAKPADIKQDCTHCKDFVIYNSAETVAIELKYRHDKNAACVTAAKEDIKKFVKYKDDSYYYSIILLEQNNRTKEFEDEIMEYYKTKKVEMGREYENKFFCRVLTKAAQ